MSYEDAAHPLVNHMGKADDELLALARKAQEVAPGAWEKDSIRTDGEYGTGDETYSGFDAFQMFAGDKVLFDSANSDASVIETEIDEDSFVHAWDETARKVFAYIAAANPAAIIALIERHNAEASALTENIDTLSEQLTAECNQNVELRAEVERLTRLKDDMVRLNVLEREETATQKRRAEAAESALAVKEPGNG